MTQERRSKSPMSRKKKAQLTGLAVLGLSLGAGAYVVQATGPDAAIRSFSQAVKAEDYEKVAALLSTASSKWSAKDAQGFVGYLEENNLQVDEILEQLKNQKAGAKVYQDTGGNKVLGLVEDGKNLFFFDTYRVSSYPVAVQITSNLDGLTIDGQTVPKDQATSLGKVKLTNQPLAILASTEFGRLDTNLLLPFEKAQKNELDMNLTAVEKELVATLPGQASDYSQVKLMVNGRKVADGLSKKLLLLKDQKLEIHASFYYMGKEFTTETKTVEVSSISDQVQVALDLGSSVKTAMKEAQVQASEEAKAAAAASASASQSREKAAQTSASQSKEAEVRKSSSTSSSSSSTSSSSSSSRTSSTSSSSMEEETQTSTSSSVTEAVVLDSLPRDFIGRWQTEDGFLEINADGSGRIQMNGKEVSLKISQLQDHGNGVYQILQGTNVTSIISPEDWHVQGGQDLAFGFRLSGDQLETLHWTLDQEPVTDYSSIQGEIRYQRSQVKQESSNENSESTSSSSSFNSSSLERSSDSSSESSSRHDGENSSSKVSEASSTSPSRVTESSSSSSEETETTTTASNQEELQSTWTKAKSQALEEFLNTNKAGAYTSVLESVKTQVEAKSLTLVQEQGQELNEEVEILDAYDYQEPGQESSQRYFFIRKVDGSSQVFVSTTNQGSTYHIKEVSDSKLTSLFEELLKK